jgi:hypothetical protein
LTLQPRRSLAKRRQRAPIEASPCESASLLSSPSFSRWLRPQPPRRDCRPRSRSSAGNPREAPIALGIALNLTASASDHTCTVANKPVRPWPYRRDGLLAALADLWCGCRLRAPGGHLLSAPSILETDKAFLALADRDGQKSNLLRCNEYPGCIDQATLLHPAILSGLTR